MTDHLDANTRALDYVAAVERTRIALTNCGCAVSDDRTSIDSDVATALADLTEQVARAHGAEAQRDSAYAAIGRIAAALGCPGAPERWNVQHVIERVTARASTPGDRDRGRKLAGVVQLAERIRERQQSMDVRDQLDDLLAALRALAAPAETEAGDGRPVGAAHASQDVARAVRVAALDVLTRVWEVDASTAEDYASSIARHRSLARLAVTPPAPEGEAESTAAQGAGETADGDEATQPVVLWVGDTAQEIGHVRDDALRADIGGTLAEFLRAAAAELDGSAPSPAGTAAEGDWPELPPRDLDERVRLVAADPDLSTWQCSVLADVRTALKWAEVDRETSKSLARRIVAAGVDYENERSTPTPAGPQAEGAGETAEEDDVVLRVGDAVHVRWLDGAGYHHGRGRLVPTDGESFPVRVELSTPDFRGAMPSAQFTDQSDARDEDSEPAWTSPRDVEGVCGEAPTVDEQPACCGGKMRLQCDRGRMSPVVLTKPSAAADDITVHGNTILEEDRYPGAIESAEQRERADARAEIDGPFAAVWRAVATRMGRGEHPSQVASAALSAIWDSAETVSGGDLIRAERLRQITDEDWSPEHDDQHTRGQLLTAALVYLGAQPRAAWPWPDTKPRRLGRQEALIKAGALIAAEVDRVRRDEAPRLAINDELDPAEASDRVPAGATVCELTSPPRIGYRTGLAEFDWQWTGEPGYRAPTARLRVVELPEGGERS